MKHKTAIIMSGGGMKCSYGAGALLALVKKYNLKEPDIVIAGSGNAGTLAYFVAQQYDSILNIWSNLLATTSFINPRRISKIIDIDYLIDEVFKKQAALDTEKIYHSKILHLIPATDAETGQVNYFSNQNRDDIFEAMRASKAMPIAYNKSVYVKGKRYCDSYISTSVKLNSLKAVDLGANKIIIIDNTSDNFLNTIVFLAWLSLKGKAFKKSYSQSLEKIKTTEFPANVQVIYLKPQRQLKISVLDNDRTNLKEAIQRGYDETCENVALQTFLKTN